MASPDPHRDQPVVATGPDLEAARAVMILIHGRGATAESILQLTHELGRDDFAYLAPQAAGYTWYPQSFLAPLEQNQPFLDSALALIGRVIDGVLRAGVDARRLMLLGFSQGACLTSEFVARNPHRYGGIVALTGGLIGPDGTPRDYAGTLDGTPVFLGSSDPDFHIPVARVNETERVLTRMGATVTKRIYPGMGHTINEEELEHVRRMMEHVAG
jgi:predicted esterase